MKLMKQSAKRNTKKSTPLFDNSPVISWNAKNKEITLRVNGVPHESPQNQTRYDYFVSVSLEEFKGMIDCIAEQQPK